MLAAIEKTPDVLAGPPIHSCQWLENPYRLVSLWDIVVILCSGENLFWAGSAIEALKNDCFFKTGVGEVPLPPVYFKGPIDEETIETGLKWLQEIHSQCELLGMPVSAETASEIMAILGVSKQTSYQLLQSRLDGLGAC